MITIIVEIQPKGEKKRGQIDPEASFDEIKESIVKAFNLGRPKDYRLFHEPGGLRSPSDSLYQDEDIFILQKIERPSAFTALDE